MRTVAIVGGGASGTLAAVHLMRRAAGPLRTVLIDRDARHGLGQAYSTTDSRHLLNVCAGRMSAFDDDPDHLLRWARSRGMDVTCDDYLPRMVYGRYLRSILDEYRDRTCLVTGNVTALAPPSEGGAARLTFEDGRSLDADAVVLATGNRTPPAARTPPGARHILDPWAPGALDGVRGGASVLVVGTGLTMVDIAVTLAEAHPATVVHAVSRHGLLPQPHRCRPSIPAEVILPEGPVRLDPLLRAFRAAVRAHDGDWRAVVDGLRLRVPDLWSRLPLDDKRRFLAQVARYWEIHRHRIPPVTAAKIDRLRAAGQLRVVRGTLRSAVADDTGVDAELDCADGLRALRVGWLINATGPTRDLTDDPFLDDLFASGTARRDPLGLGLEADEHGAVLNSWGQPQPGVFVLGPPLRGQRYETTAIPEIRAQAATLAESVLVALTGAMLC